MRLFPVRHAAFFTLLEMARGLTTSVMLNSSALSLAFGVPAGECPCLRSTHLSTCPLSKVSCVFDDKLGVSLAKGSSPSLVENSVVCEEAHPIFGHEVGWRQMVSFQQPLVLHSPPAGYTASCDPRLLPKVCLHGEYFVMPCFEIDPHAFNKGHNALLSCPSNFTTK